MARRGDAHRWLGRMLRDAREDLRPVVLAHVPQGAAALEVDGVGDVRLRGLGHGALEQPRRGRQRAEPSRGIGRAPEHGHDGGIAARRGAHQVLGDALVVQPRLLEQRGGASVQASGVTRADRLARRRRDDRVREAVHLLVEHALDAQLRLGGDGVGRLEPGERARPLLVGVGAQHRDGPRQCGRGRAEALQPVADQTHELRRRPGVVEGVAGVGEQLAEIERVAARRLARTRDHRHRRRAPQHRLDQPSGPGGGEQCGSSRANARSAETAACR